MIVNEKPRFFTEKPRVSALDKEHMSVCFLIDKSGSMCGTPIANVNANLNHFKDIVCENETAAKCVDICVIAFDEKTELVQDWTPVNQMGNFNIQAGGGTDISVAVEEGIAKLRKRSRDYAKLGILEKKPYLILMTDGYGGDVTAVSKKVTERIAQGKMKLFFLGVNGYDKTTASKLCEANGNWCFEVSNGDFNFNDFFDFIGNSVKAASASAPGQDIHVETKIGTPESNISCVAL